MVPFVKIKLPRQTNGMHSNHWFHNNTFCAFENKMSKYWKCINCNLLQFIIYLWNRFRQIVYQAAKIFNSTCLNFLGLWKLEVSHNDVSEIPSMAFYGLERALWELHLSHNKLIRVPADSITLLKKLSVLNLAGKK